MTPYTFKIVPFSKQLIRRHNLHIVPDDWLGGSTVETILDGFIKAEMPKNFAVCYFEGKPVGMAVVFLMDADDDPYTACEDLDITGTVGFFHVYVLKEHRAKGLGEKLVDLAMKDFTTNYPEVQQVRVSNILKPKFRKYKGITPVYSNYGRGPGRKQPKSFLQRVAILAKRQVQAKLRFNNLSKGLERTHYSYLGRVISRW